MNLCCRINGVEMALQTDPDRRVVDLLREELGLTGTKEGCGSGECGACSILVDGEHRLSCLMVAAQLEGRTVTTIEGMGKVGRLHPLQEAFVRCGAVQCGFCSPGMILAAAALLKKTPHPGRDEIRQGLSGNLCRCTGYQKIVDAVEAAAGMANPDGASPAAPRCGQPAPPPPPPPGCTPAGLRRGRRARQTVLLPRSLSELWGALEEEPGARVFAGGTDLLVQVRVRQEAPPALVCLERVAELQEIGEERGYILIGAGVTHGRLIADPRIGDAVPVLKRAAETLGSPPIRAMATIGGNICTASPAGDTLPPLYCLEAELELRSRTATRIMPIGSFITGPGKTRLGAGEILTAVRVKKPTACGLHHFEKIGQRRALACSIASLAALIRLSPEGTIEAVRLAWGSVGPTVVTSPAIEALLLGERPSTAVLARAAEAVRQTVSPIDDLRGTAEYRRNAAANLLLRFLHDALGRG
ncbi:MAG: FAD binding domain-containing protein [Syntrophales bacterium]